MAWRDVARWLAGMLAKGHAVPVQPSHLDVLTDDAADSQPPQWFNPLLVANHRNAHGDLAFVESSVPWIDRADADIESYVRAVKAPPLSYDLRDKLSVWRTHGYAIFEQAVSHRLIDDFMKDITETFTRFRKYSFPVLHERRGRVPISELTEEDLRHPHMRLLDFHNASVAGKKLILAEPIISFLSHVFLDQVVAMQSLTFRHGSEQGLHQDFPYVVSGIPSHLAASWIALEDVQPDAGPLGYFPGSHQIRKFDFGDGLFLTDRSTFREKEFEQHLRKECARLGLQEQVITPRKGDVFLWHAALCHEGTPIQTPGLTRLSLVAHYSTRTAYPRDRRDPTIAPRRFAYNGGCVYGDPTRPSLEDFFSHRRAA